MPHVSRSLLKDEVWQKIADLFFQTLINVKDKKTVRTFTSGFLTSTEKVMLTKRLAVFFLLEKGVKSEEMARFLKMSTSTMSRLKLWHQGLGEEQRKFLRKILKNKTIKLD